MEEVEIINKINPKKFNLVFLVVNVDHGLLLPEKACLALGLVKYCFKLSAVDNSNDISERDKKNAYEVLQGHPKLFEGY